MARIHTGFEKLAIKMNNQQKRIGEQQKMRIFRQVFQPGPISRTYYGKAIHYCSECGCRIEYIGKKVCPHCHARWTADPQEDKGRVHAYHMEMVARGEYQLCRFYKVERVTKYRHEAWKHVWEVMRIIYAPSGERRVFARRVNTMTYQWDAFSIWSPIELKRDDDSISDNAKWRHNMIVASYHVTSLTTQWKYKGIDSLMEQFGNDTGVMRVVAYPWGETLLKTGQEKLFRYLVRNTFLLPKNVVHALNICHRNHYVINDPSIWFDHLALLRHFRLDTHNAHYVCPENLIQAHNELTDRRRRERLRREADKRAKNYTRLLASMDKEKADYLKRWGAVLQLQLQGDNLSIRPLPSVEEFAAEGAAMHHCVFENGYYKRSNLILSAKDGTGARLATIEYNMQRQQIMQCRAACNFIPKRDSEIRELITSHRDDFVKLLKAA